LSSLLRSLIEGENSDGRGVLCIMKFFYVPAVSKYFQRCATQYLLWSNSILKFVSWFILVAKYQYA
jgi:hypothetical protein